VQTWSSSQQRKADAEAAAAALELAKRQNAAEALRLQQQQEKTATIKKYALPIAITGGVVILGIITYFVFKKKKIS
jgi:dihydrodipicolinate synthase/N-acetylneuraminate lyase